MSNGFPSTCMAVWLLRVLCYDVFSLNTERVRFKLINLAWKKINYFVMGNNNCSFSETTTKYTTISKKKENTYVYTVSEISLDLVHKFVLFCINNILHACV